MSDVVRLVEKLRAVEAHFAGMSTDVDDPARHRQRIIDRLEEAKAREPSDECSFSLQDPWSTYLFILLLRCYGIRPYRLPRQRQTTVMARIPDSFADRILMPEFKRMCEALDDHVKAVLAQVFDVESPEAESSAQLALLPPER